jgi:phage-related minor tail protein
MREINFEKLTKRAIAIYAKERAALVSGKERELAEIQELKGSLLSDLDAAEALLGSVPASGAASGGKQQLASLQGIIARRVSENERLARANAGNDRMEWRVA